MREYPWVGHYYTQDPREGVVDSAPCVDMVIDVVIEAVIDLAMEVGLAAYSSDPPNTRTTLP